MTTLIEIDSAATGYKKILDTIYSRGEVVSPRGRSTKELRNVVIELAHPEQNLTLNVGRRMNERIAAAEALQLIGGVQYPALMSSISANKFDRFLDGGAFHGSYGPRIAPQMPRVIDRLESDHSTRQAVVSIWNPALDLYQEGLRDLPCTVSLNFHIRGQHLHMTTHMRSNDAWLGWPYDVFQFTELFHTVANIIGYYSGTYTHVVDSMHLYEDDFDKLDNITVTSVPETIPEGGGVWNSLSWTEAAKSARFLMDGRDPSKDLFQLHDSIDILNYDWYLAQTKHATWRLH
jgi:thymidylate synthase